MNLTPEQFINELLNGKTERELNLLIDPFFDPEKINELIKNGHTLQSAKDHLSTDYTNGFTICKKCGSYYPLGNGLKKHLSNGCLHCEGEEKHKVYFVNASESRYGGFPARYMSVMFDDGLHYCKDKLIIEKYKSLISKF